MSFSKSSAIKTFVLFVLFALTLQLFLFLFPWRFVYSELGLEALSFLGIDALIHPNFIWKISILFTGAYFISYIGLLFFKSWARIFFVALSIIGGIGISLYGINVQSSFESMVGYFISIVDGFIIALAFFSPVSEKFQSTKSQQ